MKPGLDGVWQIAGRRWPKKKLAAFGVFLLAWLSPLDYSDSDAAMMLVASQALIEHGNLGFEPYADHDLLAYSLDYDDNYRLRKWPWGQGYYSLGAPILAAPAVWVGNRLGLDMLDQGDESGWQNFLSALSCALVFALGFELASRFVQSSTALMLSSAIVLGSSLISSLGTALWTSHFTVIAASIVMLTLLRFANRPLKPQGWGFLVVVVIVATACRPGSAFLGLALVVAFVLRDPRATRFAWVGSVGVIVASTSGWWLDWLPNYYSPVRLRLLPSFEGLGGVLISPSRGLFVFSPVLLLALPLGWRAVSRAGTERVVLIAIASWVTCHAWFVAALPTWWGGHSYGPRLMVDIVPGLLVLIAAGLSHSQRGGRRVMIACAVALAVPSVIVNSVSGLFNPATRAWNVDPDIDQNRELLWNWRYPQFAASDDSLDARLLVHQEVRAETYHLGRVIDSGSNSAVFDGWYGDEGRWRWSRGFSAALKLRLGPIPSGLQHRLWIAASSVDEQRVSIEIDGRPLGSIDLTPIVSEHALEIDPGILVGDATVTIRFATPGARSTSDDARVLGIALWSLRIEQAQSPVSGSSPEAVP